MSTSEFEVKYRCANGWGGSVQVRAVSPDDALSIAQAHLAKKHGIPTSEISVWIDL